MTKPRVLLTNPWLNPGGEVDQRLQEAGFETVFNPWPKSIDTKDKIDSLRGIDALVISSIPLPSEVLSATDRLKVISRTGVGYDSVDLETATKKGIVVCIAKGGNRRAVADYSFGLLLACARRLLENLNEVPKGGWNRHQGRDAAGATLGIIGLGAIGKEVAKRARGFDMRVLAYSRSRDEAFAAQHGVTYVPLEQLLRESDFVSIHTSLNEQTRHLINADRLALMKPTAYLINTARGGIVDTQALYRALKEKRIAGAALDVFEEEPLGADSQLRQLDNLYFSPHAAGNTAQSREMVGRMAAENVIAIMRGERPAGIVNPEVLQTSK